MRSGGEELGNASRLEALLGETEGSTEAGTTGTDNNAVIGVVHHVIRAGEVALRFARLGGGLGSNGIIPSQKGRRRQGGTASKASKWGRKGALRGMDFNLKL